ncbi:nucleotidyltransferase family protein [Brucella sp. TWI432]
MKHLRHSCLEPNAQEELFIKIILNDPLLRDALHRARDLKLPDCWIVSGALYNTVWNALTERSSGYGIKDIDIAYFDAGDCSWGAESEFIDRGAIRFEDFPLPVEIRNQARVHLWFEQHFGQPYEPLYSATQSIERYPAIAQCVGARLETDGTVCVHAPFGLKDIFSFLLRPNRVIDNRNTSNVKAQRALEYWPELVVEPWDTSDELQREE